MTGWVGRPRPRGRFVTGRQAPGAVANRFNRWKAPTVAAIASGVNSEEAEKFEKTCDRTGRPVPAEPGSSDSPGRRDFARPLRRYPARFRPPSIGIRARHAGGLQEETEGSRANGKPRSPPALSSGAAAARTSVTS